ncbi:hypothetical protein KKHFBJBL_01701 [Brevundimonas sp. NIBR11]|nr:hypothetical protein KKHFBJBL_01701 [Brevundimonas sp. NIBR11]
MAGERLGLWLASCGAQSGRNLNITTYVTRATSREDAIGQMVRETAKPGVTISAPDAYDLSETAIKWVRDTQEDRP